MKKVRTYTYLRNDIDVKIPATFQSLILRDYCEKNNLIFSLPAEEYLIDNCYIELINLINSMKKNDVLLTCTAKFLPTDKKNIKKISQLMTLKNLSIVCILEKITISKKYHFEDILIKNTYKKIVSAIDYDKINSYI